MAGQPHIAQPGPLHTACGPSVPQVRPWRRGRAAWASSSAWLGASTFDPAPSQSVAGSSTKTGITRSVFSW